MLLNSHQVATPLTFLAAGTYVAVLKDKQGGTLKAKFIKK